MVTFPLPQSVMSSSRGKRNLEPNGGKHCVSSRSEFEHDTDYSDSNGGLSSELR